MIIEITVLLYKNKLAKNFIFSGLRATTSWRIITPCEKLCIVHTDETILRRLVMAKKAVKKEAEKSAKSTEKRYTCKQFLRDLYAKEPNIANDKVLKAIYAKFPNSKATYKTVLTWKKELRDEGMDIPKQRAGAKPKSDNGGKADAKAGKKVIKKVKK
jgi:hypothetical protein